MNARTKLTNEIGTYRNLSISDKARFLAHIGFIGFPDTGPMRDILTVDSQMSTISGNLEARHVKLPNIAPRLAQ